jgi:hypothetical protein
VNLDAEKTFLGDFVDFADGIGGSRMNRRQRHDARRSDAFRPRQNRRELLRLRRDGTKHGRVDTSRVHRSQQGGDTAIVKGFEAAAMLEVSDGPSSQTVGKGMGVKVNDGVAHSRARR